MKKVVKYLSIIICTFIISISYVKAASYDVSVTSNTVTVGNSITLTIKGNDLAGKFTLSSSNSGVASLSGSSLWIDNNSQSVTISTSNAGTAVITITPTDVTSYDGNTITGNKSVTITVNSKPTSNPNNGGNKTGTTTTPKPTKKKSSNNNLSSLTIEGYNLDKEFKKEVTEYSVVVENDVKKIKINAQLDDSNAKVEGTGEVEVKEGNNKIEIKVTAEDGSTKTYVINVTVKELNPVEVTIGKKKYTIVRKEDENITIPSNYEKSTITIGEEEVLCYKNSKTKNILVLLKDEKGNTKLYSYNEKTKKYTIYNSLSVGDITFNIIDMPSNLVPKGYSKVSFTYDNSKLEGYQLIEKNKTYAADDKVKGSDFYLFYAINEKTGEKALYVYDKLEGTIQRFNSDLVNAYKDENNKYFMYMLISLGLLAVSIITLAIVLIKQKKHKTKFA